MSFTVITGAVITGALGLLGAVHAILQRDYARASWAALVALQSVTIVVSQMTIRLLK